METFIIIDGNSLINRAFYALPPLNGKDGTPTQAVYGFMTMLIKLLDYKPSFMAVAFDLKAPTFRHKEYDLYKANRKGMPDELAVQLPVLKALLTTMGIAVVEKEGFEADDIIGTMASKYLGPTFIVTGDRDSFQLIDDTTKVLFTKKGITEVLELDRSSLSELYSLTPDKVTLYKALAGDSSDNIPGVSGIGDKTATSLAAKYASLDALYADIDNIAGKLKDKLSLGKESAYLSLRLATIDREVDGLPLAENCPLVFPFGENVRTMFDDLGFKSLIRRSELFSSQAASVQLSECETVTLAQFEAVVAKAKDKVALIIDGTGVRLSLDGEGFFLPIKASLLDEGADELEAMEAIRPLAQGEVMKAVFDAKTLKKRLARYDVALNNYFDVELSQYLINSSVDHGSITAVMSEYGLSGGTANGLMKLYEIMLGKLSEFSLDELYYKTELPLVEVLFDMERTGFKVDRAALEETSARYGAQIELLTKEIYVFAGHSFNINSPKQLASVLFEEQRIPYPKKSKNYSTSAEILEPLKCFPIVDKVLSYRFLTKLRSTYLEGLKPMLDSDNVVHTEFKQMLTLTGRLSSIEPNLQNIPMRTEEGRRLRRLFVPREGNVLISADYSQIELRLMAHLSGDEKMVNTYRSGGDIHASTAAEINDVPLDMVTPDMRRAAKTVNFGIIYGMSDFGLSESLGISPRQASRYIDMYFKRFSGVKRYLDEAIRFAKEHGYVETIFNRRRYIPELKSSSYTQRMFGERVAMNSPLQGSAADIIKRAMVAVYDRLRGKKSKLILQIHDELIIDAAEDEADEVRDLLVECMESAASLIVPLKVEVGMGKSWYDCK